MESHFRAKKGDFVFIQYNKNNFSVVQKGQAHSLLIAKNIQTPYTQSSFLEQQTTKSANVSEPSSHSTVKIGIRELVPVLKSFVCDLRVSCLLPAPVKLAVIRKVRRVKLRLFTKHDRHKTIVISHIKKKNISKRPSI